MKPLVTLQGQNLSDQNKCTQDIRDQNRRHGQSYHHTYDKYSYGKRQGKAGKKVRVRTLDELRPYVRKGWYRVAPHAHKHALCEGFHEQDIVAAMLYGRELVRYLDDERLLALGFIRPSPQVSIPLHVVLEYSKPRWVDVVTAFVPKDAHRVISRTRLAEMLRYDREDREAA